MAVQITSLFSHFRIGHYRLVVSLGIKTGKSFREQ